MSVSALVRRSGHDRPAQLFLRRVHARSRARCPAEERRRRRVAAEGRRSAAPAAGAARPAGHPRGTGDAGVEESGRRRRGRVDRMRGRAASRDRRRITVHDPDGPRSRLCLRAAGRCAAGRQDTGGRAPAGPRRRAVPRRRALRAGRDTARRRGLVVGQHPAIRHAQKSAAYAGKDRFLAATPRSLLVCRDESGRGTAYD